MGSDFRGGSGGGNQADDYMLRELPKPTPSPTEDNYQLGALTDLYQKSQHGDVGALGRLRNTVQGNVAQQQAAGIAGAQQHGVGRMAALQGISSGQQMALQTGRNAYGQLQADTMREGRQEYADYLGGLRTQAIDKAAYNQANAANWNAVDEEVRRRTNKQTATGLGDVLGNIPMFGGIFKSIGAPILETALNNTRMSNGGVVGGQPVVFGDDSKNDIVHAKLSPGEIVIPRSIALRPDAPHKAAQFVASVKGMSDGGRTYDGNSQSAPMGFDKGGEVPDSQKPGIYFRPSAEDVAAAEAGKTQDTSNHILAGVPHNATLNTVEEEMLRGKQIEALARGQGPSSVGYLQQAASDENMRRVLQAQNQARGTAGVLNATARGGDVLGNISHSVGAQAAAENEQYRAMQARLATQEAGQSESVRRAIKDAALRDYTVAQGLSLSDQATLLGVGRSAAQGLATTMGAYAEAERATEQSRRDKVRNQIDAAWNMEPTTETTPATAADVYSGPMAAQTDTGSVPYEVWGSGGNYSYGLAQGGQVPNLPHPARVAQIKQASGRAEVQSDALARSQGKVGAGGQLKLLTDNLTQFYVKQGLSPQAAQMKALQAVGKGGK